MECLDANVVQDLRSGVLDDASRARVAAHLDGCEACRALISMLARDATRDAAIETLAGERKSRPLMETVADSTPSIALEATVAPSSLTETGPVRIRLAPGGHRQLGRYMLLERIGAGAMGVVYRAEDVELGRKVALKLLHRPDAAFTERLVREARSMAQVNHPNVVAVYDVGDTDGATYIAMELVEGQSLRDWLGRPHSIAEIVRTFAGAGRGLAAAHAAGIVHRDFKPDNCLVGDDGRVRVMDFGLASARPTVEGKRPSFTDVNLTSDGSVLGTPAYMAPEQFVGGNIDSRTDQFNFCVALYEALYGKRPFAGKSFEELGDHVCEGKIRPVPPETRVSRALHAIVVRGLSVKPGDRFPTMQHLLVELGRDRAKPWRLTAIISAVVGGFLALGLAADFVVRDRVSSEIRQSFAATGVQIDRAFDLLTSRFDANANQVYNLSVMREVAGHRDQADFGLGDEATDQRDLTELHEKLQSQDWKWVRQYGRHQTDSIIAVADYKGRMLYTSADEQRWKQDLTQLPWIKRTIDAGTQNGLVLVRTDDPRLVATGLLGPSPPPGLVFCFTRTLLLNGESASQLVQVLEAVRQIDAIRLDHETRISLVAPDHTAVGDLEAELVAMAPVDGAIVERHVGGKNYDLQASPMKGYDGEVLGHVVMAREMDDVLSLFPGARLAFGVAIVGALGLAFGTMMRARQITDARV